MITERQIKSRFQRRHLLKLVDQMLTWKLCSGEKPLLELRSGVTPESITDSINFSLIKQVSVNKKVTYLVLSVTSDGRSLSDPLKIQDQNSPYPGYCNFNTSAPCTPTIVDLFIQRALRRDRWFKDNSAIPIYI